MKKVMFVAAAALAASCFAEVTSANTVGYNTISVNAGTMTAMGVQFNDTATENTIAVKDLLTVANAVGGNSIDTTADQIWVWDVANTAWVKYFYRVQRGTVYGWCKEGTTAETADTLNNGDGFFFKRNANTATTVTLSGAVNRADPSVTYTATAGTMTYVAYPWPMDIAVTNLLTVADAVGGNTIGTTADQIWVWDVANTAWVKYFYRVQRGTVYGWCKEGASAATTDVIPSGTCFFFKRNANTSTTITFNKPASL